MALLGGLLALSMLGNFFFGYLLFRMANSKPTLLDRRRAEIGPFVTHSGMKPADAVELNEVDEEVMKKSIKDALAKGITEPVDDEAPNLYDNT